MIEIFILRASVFVLVASLFASVLVRVLPLAKQFIKAYKGNFVWVFLVCSLWATFTAFPTSAEKNRSVANVEMLPITNVANSQLGNGERGISDVNGLSITAFEIDCSSRTVSFETTWGNDIFDNAASHSLHLFMSTNLTECLWLPLGLINVPSTTNIYDFVVTSNDVAVTSRSWFLNSFNGIGFYRLAVNVDTDGDGVADSVERLWLQTNPQCSDSDADRLEDGEEISPEIGSNPLLYDTDGDGVGDGDEIAAGSNPLTFDTDGDNVPDAVEAAWIDYSVNIPWFDMTDATILSPASNKDTGLYFCDLPFTNRIAYLPISIAAADINGIVYFGNNATTNKVHSSNSTQNMAENRSFPCIAVASYCTDLYLRTSLNSQISHKTIDFEGQNYFVLQYSRVGIYNGNTNEVSFQVSIPENTPSNTVYVKYGFLADDRSDRYNVSIGAQTAHNITKLPIAYSHPSKLCITNGMSLAYHFGVGSDPANEDIDEDGVLDNIELLYGTNPRSEDSDGDGLPDKWEIDYGLNPLAAFGENGANGDLDDDLLPNVKEYEYGTSPSIADIDCDGIGDGSETGSVFITNAVPWLSFDESEDVTMEISTNYLRCIIRPMPLPLTIQGERVTNMTISANGIIFLNRAGYVNQGNSTTEEHFKNKIDENALVIAPYLEYTNFRTDIPGRETAVKIGTSTYNGEGYLLVEFNNAFRNMSTWQTNAISFQVSIPTNNPTCAYVRYKDLSGQYMTGDYASIGMQTFGSRWLHSYCDDEGGKVWENLCLKFLFGANSSPLLSDTDQDGLSDDQEVSIGTSLWRFDSDGDGMSDIWENNHNLNPQDSTGDYGADGDPDYDGLSNIDEYLNGANPNLPDSDSDGISDKIEVSNGSNPNDASDGGQAPDAEKFREIEFNINGDYAAWEMTIEGLGPNDTRTRKISMGRPNAANITSLKMLKGNSYRLSMHWLNCDGHNDKMAPWYCWKAQLDGLPSGQTFSNYTNTRLEGYEVVVGNGWIADNEDGLLTSHIHECTTQGNGSFGGGNVAGGLTATLYVLDDPKLIPDYDRDGTISDGDETKAEQKKVLHFWINDDADDDSTDGKYAESPSVDIPGAGTGWFEYDGRDPDWNDDMVNGYRDLIDFTPVFMDVSTIQILPEKIRNNLSFKLSHDSEAVNVVWSGLSKSSVGSFQKGMVNNCGLNLNESSYNAEIESVKYNGIDVPNALATQMWTTSTDKGVAFIEGRSPANAPLKLDVYYNDQKIVSGELPLHLSSVEDMYRWLNSRGLSGESVGFPSKLGVPSNRPDNDTSNRHLVFVHGANVTQNGARGWASEIFKRMWQSGMTAKFTAVTWRSDIGSDANYHENVSNAFFTASAIVQQIKELPGTKVLMAHSLGNIVCSSMIQDYELVPDSYLMCNSAVPAEAYDLDPSLRVPQLVHPEWEEYPTNSWASSWHWLFRNEPNDDRKYLGWPGRFSNVVQYAVNFYSTGDEVLELAPDNNVEILTGITSSLARYAWHKQELFKGRGGLGGTEWSGWNIEENILGINKISVTEAQAMTELDFRTNTVFYCYPSSMNATNISLLVRGAHLAQGIPALTPAAGTIEIITLGVTRNHNLDNIDEDVGGVSRPNGWSNKSSYSNRWLHSDIKDVSYFFNFKLYEKLIEKGGLR